MDKTSGCTGSLAPIMGFPRNSAVHVYMMISDVTLAMLRTRGGQQVSRTARQLLSTD